MNILQYDFIIRALAAGLLLSVSCGIIGTLIVLKQDVFLVGGISHASFGGLGLFYFLGLNPILGALTVSLLCGSVVGLTPKRTIRTHDALIGVLWTFGMAAGIILITLTPGFAPNLMTYLFGDILTVTSGDIIAMFIFNFMLAGTLILIYPKLVVYIVDPEFAALNGIPVRIYQFFYYLIISLAVVLLIRSVGIILVMALLTIPPLITLTLVKKLQNMITASMLISIIIFYGGFFTAYVWDLPTGPVIIVLGAIILILVKLLCSILTPCRK